MDNVDSSIGPKRVLTRQELHEFVWSVPMEVLSGRYGVTEKTLRKICSIHLIPVPPSGYWDKAPEASEAIRRRAKLREIENSALQTITIGERYTSPAGDYLKTVLQGLGPDSTTRSPVASIKPPVREPMAKTQPRKTPVPAAEIEARGDSESQQQPVSRYSDPNVSAFMAALKAKAPDRDGFLEHKWIKVPPNKVARVGALLQRLVEALSTDNLVFDGSKGRAGFSRDGSLVDFEITFPRKRIMVPYPNSNYSHREYRHSGRMQFRIFGWAERTRKNFSDTDTKAVEDDLEKIAESFRLNIVAEVERDFKHREEAKERARLARLRELASLRAKREEERVKFLREIIELRREIGEASEAIKALEVSDERSPEMDRMLEWGKAYISELLARVSMDRLHSGLVEKKLFSEPDELVDPEDVH